MRFLRAQCEKTLRRRFSPAENASGQEQDRAYEREESCEGDADQAKRQRQQPDEGEKHQRKERERPRENEQKAPDEKGNQRFHMISISLAHERSTGESSHHEKMKFACETKRGRI